MTQNEPSPTQTRQGPRAHPDSGLTPDQTQQLHRLLIDKRRALTGEYQRNLETGRLEPVRSAEAEESAARDTEQSTLIELAESERARLQLIDYALRKLDSGTYGVSEESEDPIGFDRL